MQLRTDEGKLQIDATEPGQTVHVRVPLSLLEDVISQLADHRPRRVDLSLRGVVARNFGVFIATPIP